MKLTQLCKERKKEEERDKPQIIFPPARSQLWTHSRRQKEKRLQRPSRQSTQPPSPKAATTVPPQRHQGCHTITRSLPTVSSGSARKKSIGLHLCSGYCKQCCNEHWGASILSNSNCMPGVGLLDHMVILLQLMFPPTRYSTQYSLIVITYLGKESKKGWICVCVYN